MAQMGWKYVSSEGKTYYIGLFHGEESGHLLIYCGSDILHMDFSVLKGSTYSFLIDNDLCEVVIEQGKTGFSYDFVANREKEAARKEQRRKLDRKHRIQTIAFTALFVGSILAATFFMTRLYRKNIRQQQEAIAAATLTTSAVGVVDVESQRGDTLVLYYHFNANNLNVSNVTLLPGGKTPFGLPVESGDEFAISYRPAQPDVNSLDWSSPTVNQIERYRKKVTDKHAILNPNLTMQQCSCQIEIAYQLKGLEGWADFFYQNASPEENPSNNQLTYLRLVRDVPFKQALEKNCW